MSKNKVNYRAYVSNDAGCGEFAGSGRNLSQLKAEVRSKYGSGWTVKIDKIENDSGIMDFAPVEICKFKIR